VLNVSDVFRSFGAKKVLAGASFNLKSASIAGLIGPSGGGKSILLKIIGGVVKRDSGVVNFDSANQTMRRAGVIDSGAYSRLLPHGSVASLMFQEGALFDSLSVFDNVAFPLVQGRVPAVALPNEILDEVHPKVELILSRVGLSRAAFKLPGQLSGGMRRRVSLARALVSRPELVLLDDPTSGLDPVASSVIMDLISELHREYLPTTIMVSHDLRRLFPVVDTVLALFNGQIVFAGQVKELIGCDNEELLKFVKCRYDLDHPRPSGSSIDRGGPEPRGI